MHLQSDDEVKKLVRETIAALALAQGRLEAAWKLNDYYDESLALEDAMSRIETAGVTLSAYWG